MRKVILVVLIGIFFFCFCAWAEDNENGSDKIYTSKNKSFSVIKPDCPGTRVDEGINKETANKEVEWVEFHLGSLHWSAIGSYWINWLKDVRESHNIPADITFVEIADFLTQQDIERNNLSDVKKLDELELEIAGHKAKQTVGKAIKEGTPTLFAFTDIDFGKDVAVVCLFCAWDEKIDDFKKLHAWEGYIKLLNSISF